jgi:protease I
MKELDGKRIAFLVTDGFEEVEMTEPRKIFEAEDAKVDLIADKARVKSWDKKEWHEEFEVDKLLSEVKTEDYDALILPGGVINPDKLRRNDAAVAFVQEFNQEEKPIGAICHGPQMLIEADIIKDKAVTSNEALKTDMENAGGMWVDADAVVDMNLVTSRHPGDIPSFTKKIIQKLNNKEK